MDWRRMGRSFRNGSRRFHDGRSASGEDAATTVQDTRAVIHSGIRECRLEISPLAEDDADGAFVEDGELESAPGLLLNDLAVGMQHERAFCFDLIVEFLDIVGFDSDFGAVFCGEFWAGNNVGFCAVALYDREVFVAVADFEAETVDEEVESLFKSVIEDLGD